MRRSFDFVIKDDDGFSKIVLRYYPKNSRVFSFDDTQPECWDDVYSTYTSYSVLIYTTYRRGTLVPSETPERPFVVSIDEGDSLLDLRQVLFSIIQNSNKEDYCIYPFSYGVDWEIRRKSNEPNMYNFTMIKNISGEAFRFELSKEQIVEFYYVLDEYLEYILKYRLGS